MSVFRHCATNQFRQLIPKTDFEIKANMIRLDFSLFSWKSVLHIVKICVLHPKSQCFTPFFALLFVKTVYVLLHHSKNISMWIDLPPFTVYFPVLLKQAVVILIHVSDVFFFAFIKLKAHVNSNYFFFFMSFRWDQRHWISIDQDVYETSQHRG